MGAGGPFFRRQKVFAMEIRKVQIESKARKHHFRNSQLMPRLGTSIEAHLVPIAELGNGFPENGAVAIVNHVFTSRPVGSHVDAIVADSW